VLCFAFGYLREQEKQTHRYLLNYALQEIDMLHFFFAVSFTELKKIVKETVSDGKTAYIF
jgi:hypothetical protein